jgi:hypothetical protein
LDENDSACHRAAILPWTALRSTLINGDAAKGEPNESIKSYPIRMVRVRPAKNSSLLAVIPLGRTPPAERLWHRSLPNRLVWRTEKVLQRERLQLMPRRPRPPRSRLPRPRSLTGWHATKPVAAMTKTMNDRRANDWIEVTEAWARHLAEICGALARLTTPARRN